MAVTSQAWRPVLIRVRQAGHILLRLGFWTLPLVTILVAAVSAWQFSIGDRVVPGVRVAGLDLSGRTRDGARELLAQRLEQQSRATLSLQAQDQRFEVTLGELGMDVLPEQADELARRAWQIGRQGSLPERLGTQLALLRQPVDIPVEPHVQRLRLDATLDRLGAAINRPPSDAALVVGHDADDPARAVHVTPSQPGLRLDVDASAERLLHAVTRLQPGPVQLAVEVLPPRVVEADLEQVRSLAIQALSAPLALEHQGRTWQLDPPLLAGMLQTDLDAGPPVQIRLDPAGLRAFVEKAAAEAGTPAHNPKLELKGTEVSIRPGVTGLAVDVDGTVAAMQQAAFGTARSVSLPVHPQVPALTEKALEPLKARAGRLLARPVTLKYENDSWTLAAADLAKALRLPETDKAESAAQLTVDLDQAALEKQVRALTARLTVQPEDAKLAVQDAQVVVQPGKDGQEVDAAAAAQAVIAALRTPGDEPLTVELRVAPVPPQRPESALQPAQQRAQKLVGQPIVLRTGGSTWSLTPAELADALVFGQTTEREVLPYLSRSKVIERLQRLAPQIEAVANASAAPAPPVPGQPAATPAPQGAPATPSPGPARHVDLEKTALAVWARANSEDRSANVEFVTGEAVKPLPPQKMPVTAGKWLEVNLKAQRLTAYEGDWPVMSTPVSSGLPRTPTPIGTFEVFTKLRAHDMRGGSLAVGDYYFLPQVPFVMYFADGGYAIHGTYWHNNFGQPMSHGCVNLPTKDAEWVFNWAPLGTKVVIF